MKSLFAGFGLLLLTSSSAVADHLPCAVLSCPTAVEIYAQSQDQGYGLLLAAPTTGCRRLRYRIETQEHVLLGKTPVLHPGDVALVRMGAGFAEGVHRLLVRAEGCGQAPALARRVTLRKASPDHGWRASLVNAAASPDRTY